VAQRTEIILLDDLAAAECPAREVRADETISFGYQGSHFEIDLSARNARRLRQDIDPFIAAARRVPSSRAPRPGPRTAARRRDTANARAWAQKNGFPWLGEKGRLPDEVMKAWEAAGAPAAP